MAAHKYFTKDTFAFLKDLGENNRRSWFARNKPRYDEVVKDPATRFILDFGPLLATVSKQFRADPRPVGGSLFRIYRDTRFSKDKSPYKTFTGIQFRHKAGKDAHAPCFYLHVEPRNVFAGVGIWHPGPEALKRIREHIVKKPAEWKRAVSGRRFKERFELAGESLKRPPRGFDPGHELIDDIKRKDFIAVTKLTQKAVTHPGFPAEFAQICRDGSPLNKYLCTAVGVSY
ncbi:MAG: DUF2461 domain-containing protein [Candidatus Latescibacterota bacterium]|nr:MAG: DUF2461 domain-containing protein [Candidatus Latescibacterota bacterium]